MLKIKILKFDNDVFMRRNVDLHKEKTKNLLSKYHPIMSLFVSNYF
jgi:hypothetical protein